MKTLLNLRQPTLYLRLFLILLFVFSFKISAQQKAFPTALGGGAFSRGNVTYTHYIVTNLNSSGPGSFWNALGDNRIVTFNVSGTIDIDIFSTRSFNNLIILGQTAPAGGITISGSQAFRFSNCNNVIIRYINFRTAAVGVDNIDCISCNNFIIDHCGFSFGGDESISFRSAANNITFQRNIISYSKTGMLLGDSDDYDVSGNLSYLYNLNKSVSHRTPNPNTNGRMDVIGNVVYNYLNRLMRTGGAVQLNEIGNNYLTGGYVNQLDEADNPLVYTAKNRRTNTLTSDAQDNWTLWQKWLNMSTPNQAERIYQTSTMFPLLNFDESLPNGDEAYQSIVLDRNVGNNAYLNDDGIKTYGLDDFDSESIDDIINEVVNENWSSSVDWVNFQKRLDYVSNLVTGIIINSHDQSTHTATVPNTWIVTKGLSPSTFNPLGYDLDPNYTNIEIYSFGVDADTSAIGVESVVVTPNTGELQVSETLTLVSTFNPDNATNQTGVWSSSDETIATVDADGVVTAVSEGVVIITFTTDDGGFTDTSQITVFPEALQAGAGENQQICEGESATLTASGGTNFVWSTGETTASIEVTPTETTTYTVTVSDDSGQTDEASVIVTVNAMPIANAGEDQTICEGEIITLTASGGDTYLWSTGETTASINVTPTEETVYDVEVSTNNCSSTDSVTVFMNEAPNLSITEDSAIMEGEPITLTASGGDNYEWSSGETTASITVSPESTTSYTVTSLGVNGCSSSAEVTVTVVPELIANAGNDVTICSGESVTLNATGGSSYSWNTGETSSELSVSPSTTTTYTVTVSDILGNSDSDSVTVTVNEIPNISVNENLTIMEGESTTLTANGAASYVWSTGETSNTITVSPLNTITYTVTGASNGCEATDEVTVTVIPELTANAGNDVTICNGESVTLNATGGSSYSWNTGDTGAELSVSPSTTTTYTVTVSDTFGNSDSDSVTVTVNEVPNVAVSDNITIIEGESTTLSVSGASTYLWNTGQTSNTITVSPAQTTTYSVTGTSNSCSAESDVTVTVLPLFTASAGSDKRVCDNDSYEVVLTASQGDSYLWSTGATTQSIVVSPVSTSTYTVTVTQGVQEDTDNVTVYVDPSPNVIISNGANVDILNGDFVTLSATGANTYEWNNGATQPNIAVSPSASTTYEVKGYIGDCYDQKQVNVNVFQRVIANAGEDVFMCLNEISVLTATGGDEYLWSTGETTQSIEVSPEETTDYTVTVFNAMHFDEDTVRVEVDASCDINEINPGEETKDESFAMFPNPASKVVHLRFSELSSASEVNIYDLNGVFVNHTKIDVNESDNIAQIKIDISSLQAGVYLVRLLVKEEVLHGKLIVK